MNWGKKLAIGMAGFMIFIMILGTIMIMRNENDTLIENDYYEKGQLYDEEYNAKKNAVDDMLIPVISTDEYGATIAFLVTAEYRITCRRLSDSRMDKIFKGRTDKDSPVKLLKHTLEPGPWLLKIEFTAGEKKYLFESEIVMP